MFLCDVTGTLSSLKIAPLCTYNMDEDDLRPSRWPIKVGQLFYMKNVAFMVTTSTIKGVGQGLFLMSNVPSKMTSLHYGGPKYSHSDWIQLCAKSKIYSLVEDDSVTSRNRLYIVGDVQHGNVVRYINSCKYCKNKRNVQYVFSLGLPPLRKVVQILLYMAIFLWKLFVTSRKEVNSLPIMTFISPRFCGLVQVQTCTQRCFVNTIFLWDLSREDMNMSILNVWKSPFS